MTFAMCSESKVSLPKKKLRKVYQAAPTVLGYGSIALEQLEEPEEPEESEEVEDEPVANKGEDAEPDEPAAAVVGESGDSPLRRQAAAVPGPMVAVIARQVMMVRLYKMSGGQRGGMAMPFTIWWTRTSYCSGSTLADANGITCLM